VTAIRSSISITIPSFFFVIVIQGR
jgi:hypothetical protein